ncbi:hypothetical protein MMC13_004252 [Lambiella insularis]|nr:hypothetical protein [Lambiella insularis]
MQEPRLSLSDQLTDMRGEMLLHSLELQAEEWRAMTCTEAITEWQGRASEGNSNSSDISETDYSSEDDIPATGPHPSYLQPIAQLAHSGPSKAIVQQEPAARRSAITAAQKGSSTRMRNAKRQPGNARRVRMPEFKRDSPAEARWRKNAVADGTFDLPTEYYKLTTYKATAATNENPFIPLNDIGKRTRTFIRPANSDSRKLRIWATLPADLEAARQSLSKLIHEAAALRAVPIPQAVRTQSGRSYSMPKVMTETKKQAKKIRDQQEAYEKKELYRKEPSTVDNFSFTGTFQWPATEIHPDNAFGHGHVTLDQLRTFYECFIKYDRARSAFRILTSHFDGLQAIRSVIICLRTALAESATRKSIPLEVYLIDPPHSGLAKSTVRMMDTDLTYGKAVGRANKNTSTSDLPKVAQLCGHKIAPMDCVEWDKSANSTVRRNRQIIRKAIEDCVLRMAYYRGVVRIRVHMGVFVFGKYFAPRENMEISTVDFMGSINDSNTKGGLDQIKLAWQMQVSADNRVEESIIAPEVLRFSAAVESLVLKKSDLSNMSTSLMFKLPEKTQFPKVNTYFQQRTTWQYRLKANSAYIFEVARYDKFDTDVLKTVKTPIFTQWGFYLWCTSWDEKLVQNSTLKLGDKAQWGHSVDEFFPRNRHSSSTGQNPGFDDYLHNLGAIVDFLSESLWPEKILQDQRNLESSRASLIDL